MADVSITYRFVFTDGRKLEHVIQLDGATGKLLSAHADAPAEWTALEFKKCDHCPLKPADSQRCPVALNLSKVAEDFKGEKSYEKVTVEVLTAERTYTKQLPLQDGLFGLFGLIMATSDCPYMSFLRPMARFHLPFSTLEETTIRSVGFYLLRQLYVMRQGGKPDFSLSEFTKLYENLTQVNVGIINRIRSIAKADADMNSIVGLDAFASLLSTHISNQLSDLDSLFAK